MSDPSPQEPPRDDGAALSALVTAQLRAARAEVFHAWQRSREKARRLAGIEPGLEPADEDGRPSS